VTIVVNTSPLVALDRIGQLDLLPKLFGKIIRPQSVVDELNAGRKIYGGSDALFHAAWLETAEDPPEMVLRKELGAGETAAIALALRIKADLVILDDLAARNVAAELELKVTGTLGILLAAHKKGILKDLQHAITQLTDSGFRVSDTIVASILKIIG
jgi:predicted nucleic acid-binding protein